MSADEANGEDRAEEGGSHGGKLGVLGALAVVGTDTLQAGWGEGEGRERGRG